MLKSLGRRDNLTDSSVVKSPNRRAIAVGRAHNREACRVPPARRAVDDQPEHILDMNIARYRELIRTEKDPQFRAKLEEALARDIETKRQLAKPIQLES